MAGIPVRDIMATLISELEGAKPDLDEVCNFKRRIGSQMVVEIGIPKIDIVVDIAKKYHGKIPLAVASSGYKDHVINSLKVNGIYDLFDAIVTAEDIANPKPAPDIFLMACHRIGCDPTKCRGNETALILYSLNMLYTSGLRYFCSASMKHAVELCVSARQPQHKTA